MQYHQKASSRLVVKKFLAAWVGFLRYPRFEAGRMTLSLLVHSLSCHSKMKILPEADAWSRDTDARPMILLNSRSVPGTGHYSAFLSGRHPEAQSIICDNYIAE
jgi:hypothetical protein